ncbi:TPA: ead/Ea22-like family protein [Klebsiella pneumoniae]
MTTDITELAQSLKAAAENAGADCWQAKKISGDFYVIRKGSYKRECGYTTYQPIAEIDHKPTRDYVAMANPTNILALVEALEKAQTINAAAEKLVRCKGRYHSEQNYRALAALFGVNTPDLPPLDDESHAVTVENLQESAYRAGLTAGWNLGLANNNDGFNKCLAAHTAGIKVEAE